MRKLLIIFTLLFSTFTFAIDTINLTSWNIRNLSSNSRSDAELGLISVVLARYELIALQELRTETER